MQQNDDHSLDIAKLSLLDLIKRVKVGQLLAAVVGVFGVGFYTGGFQSGYMHSKEVSALQIQLKDAESKDRSGPFGAPPTEPCDILTKGNDLYKQGELEKAMMVYKTIEFVDRLGKKTCSDSVYATIATVNTLLLAKLPASDTERQAFLKSETARYRSAEAASEKCQAGDCAASLAIWKP
jgi:hypothetical protein